jgi:hypothetical protein
MSKELEQAFREFVPSPPMVLEYRLYYDHTGVPLTMSSHNHPDGNYIIITKDIYDRANYNCCVVNGKLEPVDTTRQVRVQLYKSTSGMPVVAGHAGLPVEQGDTYKDLEYYDRHR